MNKKLYVGNLSFNMDEQALADLFSQFGHVESAKIIVDRESGRSKGFAFVEMGSDAEANTAIEKLNGTEQFQRAMNVMIARPMEPRTGGGGGNRNFSNKGRY